MRIPKKQYDKYIASEEWKLKREEVFLIKGRACEKCKTKSNLCIHHGTYVRLGNELIDDLFVLCNKCHFDLHELCGTRDLLRNTKRFIQGLEYEERSNTKVNQAKWKEYYKERKRVKREKNKRKNARRKERIANGEIIISKENIDYSTLEKYYGVFKPINNSKGFDFREFYYVDGKVKKLKIIPIPQGDLSKYPVFKIAKLCDKNEFKNQFIEHFN